MGEIRNAYKSLAGKPKGKRVLLGGVAGIWTYITKAELIIVHIDTYLYIYTTISLFKSRSSGFWHLILMWWGINFSEGQTARNFTLLFMQWRWKQHGPPKLWCPSISVQGVTTQYIHDLNSYRLINLIYRNFLHHLILLFLAIILFF